MAVGEDDVVRVGHARVRHERERGEHGLRRHCQIISDQLKDLFIDLKDVRLVLENHRMDLWQSLHPKIHLKIHPKIHKISGHLL